MRIKNLTVQGFRGFNEKCVVDFHDNLTLISGPNSYGKTSISEALEFLLYGETSKIAHAAGSKIEYKGSYRNCHFKDSDTPFIEATFIEGNSGEIKYRTELTQKDSIQKLLNGAQTDSWEWERNNMSSPRPFIIQHALKNLLLTTPAERYRGFTRLIGAEELSSFQDHFVSLCTKYEPHIPSDVQDFLESFTELEKRLASLPPLTKIFNLYKRKTPDTQKVYEAIIAEGQKRLADDATDDGEILPRLQKQRKDVVSKLFDKDIVLPDYSDSERYSNANDETYFGSMVTDEFITQYIDLLKLASIQHLLDQDKFLNLGLPLLEKTPEECPFCEQQLDGKQRKYILDKKKKLKQEMDSHATLQKKRGQVLEELDGLHKRIKRYHNRQINKTMAFLLLKEQVVFSKLEKLLTPKYEAHFQAVQMALAELEVTTGQLKQQFNTTVVNLNVIKNSVEDSKEDVKLIKALGVVLLKYVDISRSYAQAVSNRSQEMLKANEALKQELDMQAGTEEISILIDILEQWNNVKKKFRIQRTLESLKLLRKTVDEYVTQKLITVVESKLTEDVMKWYDNIKTTGDPDVHFSGFDLPKTKSGTVKARQIGVKAISYGTELVSAVSSLSESKLNALGLCMNIANNLGGDSPFEFLIVDDPMQSLDSAHSTQLVQIIRKLVEKEKKQIILLSHDHEWLKTVRKSCRTLNGYNYEITGYTKMGPVIVRRPWAAINERYGEISTILNSPDVSTTERQRAAEEFRLLFNELTADIYCAYAKQSKKS